MLGERDRIKGFDLGQRSERVREDHRSANAIFRLRWVPALLSTSTDGASHDPIDVHERTARIPIFAKVVSLWLSLQVSSLPLPRNDGHIPIMSAALPPLRTRDEALSGTVPRFALGSPRFTLVALEILMVIAGLLGSDAIGFALCRSLIVERSNPANRSKNLAGAQLSLMLGLVVGPTGFSWIAERWPSDASEVRGLLQLVWGIFGKLPPERRLHQSPIATPGAPAPDGSFTNRTAFFCSVGCVVIQLLIAMFFIPDTPPNTAVVAEEESRTATPAPTRNHKGSSLSTLLVLKPFRNTRTGQLDTRLLRLVFIAALNLFGGLGIVSLLTYLTYAGVSPLKTSYMLSWAGFTRVIVLLVGFPLAVAFAGKLIRKPAVLAQLSTAQLEDLTSRSKPLETPDPEISDEFDGDVDEEQYGLLSASSRLRQSQGRASSAEASRLSVIFDEDARKTMLKALAWWRTKIDLALLRASLM